MSLVFPQHIRGHEAQEFERSESVSRKQRRLLPGQSHYLQVVISAMCVCVCVGVCMFVYKHILYTHMYKFTYVYIYTHI